MPETWKEIKARMKAQPKATRRDLVIEHIEETNPEGLLALLSELPLEPLLAIQKQLPTIIEQKRELSRDRRLEQAILYLAGRCDGAMTRDGAGFNGADTGFGHWLAERIEAKQPLILAHAATALKMATKYKGQLEESGLTLPEWEAIAHQYAVSAPPPNTEESKPEKRIEIIKEEVAVFAPYDETGKFQKVAKSIEGYRFKNSDKSWRYPLEKIEEVVAAFPDCVPEENIKAVLAHIQSQKAAEKKALQQAALESASKTIELISAAELDSPLPNERSLFAHQKEAVKWLLAHRRNVIHRGGILADLMGLGKTCSALVAAKAMKAVYNCPVFVVCPASLQDNWLREAEGVGVAIEVYSWAKLPKPLDTSKYVLIADEAHAMQDLKTKRTQGALDLAAHENCLATWLLSGTPVKNGRPINLYPLLLACKHPIALDQRKYELHYCAAGYKDIGKKTVWDATGAAHLDELAKKTEDVILRRTKKECLDLPPKIRQLKPAELSNEAESIYSAKLAELKKTYRERVKAKLISNAAEALVTLGQLRLAGSIAKVEAAIALAEELLEQGEPVVLFTEFTESAIIIHQHLGGELLTGDTPTSERQAIVDRFQAGESKVFVGTIKAGGVGLTLTAASHVILVDRPWSPGDAEQAEDRLHRIGQGTTVNAIWLQHGRIDEMIDSLLESKQERIELVLKGKRKTLRGLAEPAELAQELLKMMLLE